MEVSHDKNVPLTTTTRVGNREVHHGEFACIHWHAHPIWARLAFLSLTGHAGIRIYRFCSF